MPVPTHIFDPPFNIVRCSHVVLGVTDLTAAARSTRPPSACMSRTRRQGASICAAARSTSITRWCCARRRPPACTGSASRSATRTISTRPPASFPRTASPTPSSSSRSRAARCSSPIPFGFQLELYAHDGEAPASAAALRSLQGLPSAAARPFQRVRARRAGHRRFLRPARLPPHRIRRGRRTERAASRRPGCTARATCTTSPSPTAAARACTTSPTGCRRAMNIIHLCDVMASTGYLAEHRARPRPPRHFQRLLPLCPRSRRPPDRDLHLRLPDRGPRPRADALVAEGPAAPDAVGRAGAALLVRGGLALRRARRCANRPSTPTSRSRIDRRQDGSSPPRHLHRQRRAAYGAVTDAGIVDLSARFGKVTRRCAMSSPPAR